MTETVLILGAAGRFGYAAARAFDDDGWRVRRWLGPGRADDGPGAVFHGDLHDGEAMAEAAYGADVIVNALNPPYPDWAHAIPEITKAVIAAARNSGAAALLPGNVYNYGAGLPAVLSEGTLFIGDHRKARIRIEMEAAYRESGVRTLILRAGDFIDTRPGENWFEGQIAAKVISGKIVYPGPLDRPHAWAYLPDLARAASALATERGRLPDFADIGFPGFTLTGEALIDLVEGAVERKLRRGRFPWFALRLLALGSPMMREVLEMRYLWQRGHRIDGGAFAEALPGFTPTDPEEAIRRSLTGAGQIQPEAALNI